MTAGDRALNIIITTCTPNNSSVVSQVGKSLTSLAGGNGLDYYGDMPLCKFFDEMWKQRYAPFLPLVPDEQPQRRTFRTRRKQRRRNYC